jgi:hypothetical protein
LQPVKPNDPYGLNGTILQALYAIIVEVSKFTKTHKGIEMKELKTYASRCLRTVIQIPTDIVDPEFLPEPGKEVRATLTYLPPMEPSMDDPLAVNHGYFHITWDSEEISSYPTTNTVSRPEWRGIRALRSEKELGDRLFDRDVMIADRVFSDSEVREVISKKIDEVTNGE